MNYWFTSDTHLGHANIIKYSKRPFTDVHHMDAMLIQNWRALVKPEDTVYHLGDFCFGWSDKDFQKYFRQLTGQIILVKGNHDKLAWQNRSNFTQSFNSYAEIKIGEQAITLCHYAMRVWNKSHRGAWHLYGHSHGSLPDDPNSLSFDVGVDCQNYRPINLDEVAKIMSKKNWIPIDHHGDRQEGGGDGLSKDDYAKLERKKKYLELKKEFEG